MRNMARQCVYCNNWNGTDPWSDEHVLPRSIGGNVSGANGRNPFLISKHDDGGPDVCCFCNNYMGRYADGRFVWSWLIQAARATTQWKHVDLGTSPALPLVYLGQVVNAPNSDGRICDAWRGPAESEIFHFHLPYPTEPQLPIHVGRPFRESLPDFDLGYTMLGIRSTNEAWHGTIVRSALEAFEAADLYFANGPVPLGGPFLPIPPNLEHVRQWVVEHESAQMTFQQGANFDERFSAKMALGLGSLILEESFRRSSDAQLLRDVMFCPDDKKRQTLGSHGTSYLLSDPAFVQTAQQFLGWEDGHVISLRAYQDQLLLVLVLFGGMAMTRVVSKNPSHWEGLIPENGHLYLVL